MHWCCAGIWAKAFTTPAWSTFRRRHGLSGDRSARFRWRQKMDGVKRHVLVGFGDILVAVVVTRANVQDRAAFPKLLCRTKRTAPTIACVWVDMRRLDRSQLFDTL
jgi:hypothetical protein